MIKRQWIVSGVVSFLILVVAGIVSQVFRAQKKSTVSEQAPRQELAVVNAQTFPKKDIQSTIEIDGRLNAYEKIDLAAEVTGRLLPIQKTWREGSYFEKGELLFQINSEDQRFDLYAERSNLMNAITQIMPDLKFDYPASFIKWKEYLDGFDVERITPQLPKVTNEQEKYYVAGKNIYNTYYTIKSLEDRMMDYQVFAPFNGVFLSVNSYPGALVNPGGVLGRVMNTGRYELETPISTEDYSLVKRGQSVKLVAKDIGTTYDGTINRVGNQIDQTTQSIPIYITVRGRGLKDGMYLTGQLNGTVLQEVSTLPVEALVSQNAIYHLQDSIIRTKEVEVILRTEDQVHVRGIEPTDMVITRGVNSLSPGQKAVTTKP